VTLQKEKTIKPPITKHEGKINNLKAYKAMVLKLHAKEGIKVHMTKLLTETIWRAKEVRKNIRKLKKLSTTEARNEPPTKE